MFKANFLPQTTKIVTWKCKKWLDMSCLDVNHSVTGANDQTIYDYTMRTNFTSCRGRNNLNRYAMMINSFDLDKSRANTYSCIVAKLFET